MNFELPNYTGPYRSNGEFQTSVAFGETTPKNELDALSRLHDSAYANYKDYGHRVAADKIYNDEAKKLIGAFPSLAGSLVLYGNQAGRSVSNLATNLRYGPIGIVAGALKNGYDLSDYMINGTKYVKEVKAYYGTDPFKSKEQPSKLSDLSENVPIGLKRISDPDTSSVIQHETGQGGLLNGLNLNYNPYRVKKKKKRLPNNACLYYKNNCVNCNG